jgi:hypothetical protein
MYRNNLRT